MTTLRVKLRALVLGAAMIAAASTVACTDEAGERADADSPLDLRLETHAVLSGEVSEAGLAYVRAVAEAHRQADAAASDDDRATVLLTALEQPPPANDGTAELLHLQLAARAGETLLAQGRPAQALTLLQPLLAPARSLPLDRVSARALVTLGDAAAQTGDRGLAMSAYARALEVLSLLLEEAES